MRTFWKQGRLGAVHTKGQKSRHLLDRAVHAAVESLEKRQLFATVAWTGAASGNWSTAANWSTNSVPGANDDVVINPAGALTITVDGTQSVKSITATGDDTVNITGTLNTSADSNVRQLTMAGFCFLNTSATFTISGTSSAQRWSAFGGTGTFVNSGDLTLNGDGVQVHTDMQVTGTLQMYQNGIRTDSPTGKVRALNGGTITLDAVYIPPDNNAGGVIAEAGGTVVLKASSGAISANGGTIRISKSDVFGGFSGLLGPLNNATIASDAGTQLNLGVNSIVNVSGDIVGTGTGTVFLQTDSTVKLTADTKFNFAAGMFQVAGRGTIDGPGTLTNNGAFSVYGSGFVTIKTKLINYGTFRNSVQTYLSGATAELRSKSGSFITGSGSILADGNAAAPVGLFMEAGSTLNADESAMSFYGNIPMSLTGVTIKNGTGQSISFGSSNMSINGADFQVPSGNRIDFSDGSVTSLSGEIKGLGQTDQISFLNGSTLNIPTAGVTFNTTTDRMFRFYNATVNGPGAMTVAKDSSIGVAYSPTFTTQLVVSGTLGLDRDRNPGLNLNGANSGVHVTSTGRVIAMADINGQVINNTAGTPGTFKMDAGAYLEAQSSGYQSGLSINVPFDNLGTVNVLGGMHINSDIKQLVGTTGNMTLTGGRYEFRGILFDFNGRSFNTLGPAATIIRGGGPLRFPPLDSLNNLQGTLELIDGLDLPLTSSLTNSGKLILDAGTSLSVGSYTQTLAGSVEYQVNGTGANNIGQLIGSGPAILAGTAVITAATGYTPAINDSFALQTFTSRTGTYSSVQGNALPPGTALDPAYTNTTFGVNLVGGGSANLAVTAITPPASGVAGQNVNINYTVTNQGGPTTVGTWSDTIYLSKDGILDGSDTVLARVTHTGALSAGGSYAASPTVPLVGVLPGSYHLVIVTDSQGVVADTDRTNNTAASVNTIAVTVPALTPGTAFNGTIKAGQSLYYQVTLPAGKTPTFTFTGAVNGQAEVFTSLGSMPTREEFDQGTYSSASPVQRITGSVTSTATYFILLYGREPAGNGQTFSLLADGVNFGINSSSVSRGSNLGRITTTLTGSQFSPTTTFSLKAAGGSTRAAVASTILDATSASATFNLAGLSAGVYSIVATDGAKSATLSNALTVTAAGAEGQLKFSFDVPANIRPAYYGVAATLTYTNVGQTDMEAPLFYLYGLNAKMRLADDGSFPASTPIQTSGGAVNVLELLGTSGGLAGTLSPGETGQIKVYYEPLDTSSHTTVHFEADVVTNQDEAVDWDELKDDYRPAATPTDAWDAIYSNFKASVGTTTGSYISRLAADADYLGQFGPVSPDVQQLLSYELQRAGNFGEIQNNYALGDMGRGTSSPYADRISESNGVVSITNGAGLRLFKLQSNGKYKGVGNDLGVITKSGGTYHLQESTGDKVFFESDGRIGYTQTPNGRITSLTWTSGKLTRVTDNATGDQVNYTYNSFGRVATATDETGLVTTFNYDAAGQHLTSIVDPTGTYSYTYVTGQGAASEHATASYTTPDGVTTFYTYDTRGRLTSSTVGTGPNAVRLNYAYDEAGKMVTTNGAGNVVTLYTGIFGSPLQITDANGNTTKAIVDANGNVTRYIYANGASASYQYNGDNLLVAQYDAARNAINTVVGGTPTRLQRYITPTGSQTDFDYDTAGNLLKATLPDSSTETYEYDSLGRVVASTNALGQKTSFTYNSKSLLIQKKFADGSTVDYTYDAHRNLQSATDAGGTTSYTYDAANRVTSIAYANGKTVTISYDAAGRRTALTDGTYTVKYSYDVLGRLAGLRDGSDNLIVNYGYNALGYLASESRGNGDTTAYTYDAAGNMASVVHRNAASTVLESFSYTYDSRNRITSQTSQAGTTNYAYDLTGQLAGVTLPGGRAITYSYDGNGNRKVVTDSLLGNSTYASNSVDAYTSAGNESFTYDAAGRVLTRTVGGVTTTYGYDFDNHLISIASPGNTTTFDYDAVGNRIGATTNGVRTDYAFDPGNFGTIFGEYQNGSAVAHYSNGLGVASRTDAAGTNYYHYDASGNTALLSDASGASVATYKYLPFGEILSQTGSTANPFTFDGRLGVQDDAANLYYMRARTYDAGTGRFTTRDPLGLSAGDPNLYRFVANDPVNRSDPTGLFWFTGSVSGEVSVGRGGNASLTLGINPDNLLDSGLYLTTGESSGATAGVGGTVGFTQEITGPSESVNITGGPVTGSFSQDSNGNITSLSGGGTLTLSGPAKWMENAKKIDKVIKGAQGGGITKTKTNTVKLIKLRDFTNIHDDGLPENFKHKVEFELYRNRRTTPLFNEAFKKIKKRDNLNDQDAYLKAKALLRKIKNEEIRKKYPDPNKNGGSHNGRPSDPNNIIGPAGFAADELPDVIAPGQTRFDGFVRPDGNYGYRIEFENKPTADVPAQVVTVTQTLDSDLDLSTFRFTSFGFGKFLHNVPDNLGGTSYSTVVDAVSVVGVKVRIDASLNPSTRQLTVVYTSLDPNTNDLPIDALAGFLPPNVNDPEGDGYLTYQVSPKSTVTNGTRVDAKATIVFDTENPIDTPAVHNTIDTAAPVSQIAAVAASSTSPVTLNWAGSDANGSGIASYDIFVSDNGGAYTLLLDDTTLTSYAFAGTLGHVYRFYSVATDNVGYTEAAPNTPDAITTITEGGGGGGQNGSISGVLWNDSDSDGIFDANESPSGARQVFIDANANGKLDAGERTVMSDSRGRYTFNNLPAGSYNVSRVFPTGYRFSNSPIDCLTVNLAAGQNLANVNIGSTNKPRVNPPPTGGSIAGTLFNDDDKDGIFDAIEKPSGVRQVFLDTNGNGKLDSSEKSVMSDSLGRYKFTALSAGNYKVSRVSPSGYRLSNNALGYVSVAVTTNQNVTGVNLGTRTK